MKIKSDLCPICGDQLVPRQVEVTLRGGENVAIVRIPALKCLYCREELYVGHIVEEFEKIRSQLARGETDDFKPLGKVYEVEVNFVPHLKMLLGDTYSKPAKGNDAPATGNVSVVSAVGQVDGDGSAAPA